MENEGAIKKLGDFLGISKFGQGLATTGRVLSGSVNRDIETQNQNTALVNKLVYAAKQETDPTKRSRLLQLAQSTARSSASAMDIDSGLNLSNREVLGSAANIVLNIATPGTFKGGKAAILGKNALLGSAFGVASGLERNRSAGNILGSAVGGALVGTAIGGGSLALKGLKDFIGNKTPVWMMNKAVKPALNDLRKNIKYGSDTLGKELLDEGVRGGPKKLLQIADAKLSSLEDELQGVLSSPSLSGVKITRKQLSSYLDDLVTNKAGTPGLGGEVNKIKSIVNSVPESLTLQQANQMKRRIYNELRDPAYKLDVKLGTKARALKQIARGLKTEIENAVGGNVVKDINRKLSIYGRMEETITDQLARALKNNAFSLTDGLLLTAGAAGSLISQDQQTRPVGLLLALAGIVGRHNSVGLSTFGAQTLKKVGQIGTGKLGQTARGAIQRGLLNIP